LTGFPIANNSQLLYRPLAGRLLLMRTETVSANPNILFVENRRALVDYATRIVRDRDSAEDIVQEAWVRFSMRAHQGGEIVQPLRYFYMIVRNIALTWLKRRAMQGKVVVPVPEVEAVPQDAPSAEQILYYKDEMRVMAAAISELPERLRIAFRLYKIEGHTLQEVAARLDVSAPRAHQMVKEAGLRVARRVLGDER